MLITTTATIDKPVTAYLGVVTGDAVLGANIFRDIFASVRDIVGGRSAAYEKELDRAKQLAFEEMTAKAEALGAAGIIGVDVDYEALGGSMLMVSVSGTAVKF